MWLALTSLIYLPELPTAFVYLETINQSRLPCWTGIHRQWLLTLVAVWCFFFFAFSLSLFARPLFKIVLLSFVLVLGSTYCILLITGTNSFLGTRSHICEKRLLTRHVRLYVCLSSCSCATPIERISVELSVADFCGNPSRSSKFGWNRTEPLCSLHKDVNTFYCWQWQIICRYISGLCYISDWKSIIELVCNTTQVTAVAKSFANALTLLAIPVFFVVRWASYRFLKWSLTVTGLNIQNYHLTQNSFTLHFILLAQFAVLGLFYSSVLN